MKNLYLLILLFATLSSCNKKTILLPEIQNAKITDIIDVSPAYIFYDITKPDSVELNRKNLISTTNWLVNVDKRLKLKQAIPHIKFLQEKKRNSSHKNENAKNYFTCNDTSIKNLGFIDFTDIVYESSFDDKALTSLNSSSQFGMVEFISSDQIEIKSIYEGHIETLNLNFDELLSYLSKSNYLTLKLSFNSNLTFQDYITIKSLLRSLKNESTSISNEEFIY